MLCKPVHTYTTSSWKKTTLEGRQVIFIIFLSRDSYKPYKGKLFACEHVCNLRFFKIAPAFGQFQAAEAILFDASLIPAWCNPCSCSSPAAELSLACREPPGRGLNVLALSIGLRVLENRKKYVLNFNLPEPRGFCTDRFTPSSPPGQGGKQPRSPRLLCQAVPAPGLHLKSSAMA